MGKNIQVCMCSFIHPCRTIKSAFENTHLWAAIQILMYVKFHSLRLRKEFRIDILEFRVVKHLTSLKYVQLHSQIHIIICRRENHIQVWSMLMLCYIHQAGALKGHARIHSWEKPHVCEESPATFKDAMILNKHLIINYGE